MGRGLTVVVIVYSGVAHGAYNNDIEALLGVRELINYLPLSNREHAPIRKCDDPWSVQSRVYCFKCAVFTSTPPKLVVVVAVNA